MSASVKNGTLIRNGSDTTCRALMIQKGINLSDSSAECRARAAVLRATYGDSPLANVRDRYEAAALKWDAMALQAERTERGRAAKLTQVLPIAS